MCTSFLLEVTKGSNSNYLTKVFNVTLIIVSTWVGGSACVCVAEVGDGLERWDRGCRLYSWMTETGEDYISFKCFLVFEVHNYIIDHT